MGADADFDFDAFAGFWIDEFFGGEVWVEAAAGVAVGVTDVVSDCGAFATELTDLRHNRLIKKP